MDKKSKLVTAIFLSALTIQNVCAEDLLKPLIDTFFNAMKALYGMIAGFIFNLFPGLQNSFAANPFGPIANIIPGIENLAWLFYLAVFFAVIAVVAKMWMMGKHFIVNTVVGLLLLLILIHVLGVGIEITILKLILTAIFGIPGVILVVILHYLGIPI